MNPPTVLQALGAGLRAVGRALWLAPVAFALAVLGEAAQAPAPLFLGAIGWRAAGAVGGGVEALGAGAAALTSPRAVSVWMGLWLAGLLVRAALRVLWLGGAIGTLGEGLSGRGAPAFAGVAVWGFPRLLATALLTFLLDLAAGSALLGTGVAVALLGGRLAARAGSLPAALLAALALTGSAALLLLVGALGDAALARTALRGEPAGRALVAAAVRVGDRPGAFLAVALGVGLAALVIAGSADAAMGAVTRLAAAGAPPLLLLAPQLLATAAAAMLGALFELWRLGALAVLSCHAAPGDGG